MNTQLAKRTETQVEWTRLIVSAKEDLSVELNSHVARRPGDEVRCVRVYGDSYRCNWWTREAGIVGNAKIRCSRFLRVTRVNGKLVVADVTGR
jgi:hypothetical protein